MPTYGRFFGSEVEGEPKYNQSQFAEAMAKIFGNGVFANVDNDLEVVENTPPSMSVIVKTGWLFNNGYWFQNDDSEGADPLIKTLSASDPDNPRIDRIVLRLDLVENLISCEVLEGTPAGSPDPPELTQDIATWEISLAQILVGEDVTTIADEDITDERTYVAISNAPVTLTNAVTLTNKTLTTPTLTKPVINGTNPTGAVYTPASGAQGVALDCAANNMHMVTGHADGTAITFTVSNATNNQPFMVSILQGAVVSTISAWFATIRWVGGVTPTLTAVVGKRDTFGFIRTGENTYDGFIVGQNN